MTIAAVIQFTQGPNTDIPGNAVIGTLTDGAVTCASTSNTGVTGWVWSMIDVPAGSAIPIGGFSVSSVTTFPQPDVVGGYLVQLVTSDGAGGTATALLVFQVPELSGRIIPPYKASDTAMNFGGQKRGWAKYLAQWLKYLDAIPLFSVAGSAVDGSVVALVGGVPTWKPAVSAIVPHDTSDAPVALYQLAGSLVDTGSGATALTANSLTQYCELWPGLKGWDGLGGNGFHSTVVDPAALALTGDMTIAAFVRSPDNLRGLGTARSIICFDTNAGGTLASNILYSIGISSGGFPQWIQQHGSNTSDIFTLTTDIFPSGLFHLAVTRISNVIQMYVNGLPLGAASSALTTPTGGTASSFRFGTQGGAPLAVALASVEVIASGLTAAQIKAKYNKTFGPVFGLRA